MRLDFFWRLSLSQLYFCRPWGWRPRRSPSSPNGRAGPAPERKFEWILFYSKQVRTHSEILKCHSFWRLIIITLFWLSHSRFSFKSELLFTLLFLKKLTTKRTYRLTNPKRVKIPLQKEWHFTLKRLNIRPHKSEFSIFSSDFHSFRVKQNHFKHEWKFDSTVFRLWYNDTHVRTLYFLCRRVFRNR